MKSLGDGWPVCDWDQKKWEKKIAAGEVPTSLVFDEAHQHILRDIASLFKEKRKQEAEWRRDSLHNSVQEALEFFTPEECKQIFDEAVVESVQDG